MTDDPFDINVPHRTPIDKVSDKFILERLKALALAGHSYGGKNFIPLRLKHLHIEVKKEATRRGLNVLEISPECDPPPEHFKESRIRYLSESRLEAFVHGQISLGESESYKNDPHSGRRDDEMQKSYFSSNTPVTIGGVTYKVLEMKHHVNVADEKGPIRYHFLSLSWEKSRKLVKEFNQEGGGYVMIHDYWLFVKLLRSAIEKQHPKADFCAREVTYFDDLTPIKTTDFWEAINLKSVNYFYQRETRISVLDALTNEKRLNVSINPPPGLMEIQRFH